MESSDKRFYLLNLLENYKSYNDDEEKSRKAAIKFVKKQVNCFDSHFKKGHITCSSFIVDKNFEYTLIANHTKIGKWLQVGGHSDDDPNPMAVGLREATEETGLKSLMFLASYSGIFDIDVHPIPENAFMPLHTHYDLRFLLVAEKNEKITITKESKEIKWVKLENVSEYINTAAFCRLTEKVKKTFSNFSI